MVLDRECPGRRLFGANARRKSKQQNAELAEVDNDKELVDPACIDRVG